MTPLEAKYIGLILCVLSRHFIDEAQVPEYKELGKLMRALYFFQDGECTKLCRKNIDYIDDEYGYYLSKKFPEHYAKEFKCMVPTIKTYSESKKDWED